MWIVQIYREYGENSLETRHADGEFLKPKIFNNFPKIIMQSPQDIIKEVLNEICVHDVTCLALVKEESENIVNYIKHKLDGASVCYKKKLCNNGFETEY